MGFNISFLAKGLCGFPTPILPLPGIWTEDKDDDMDGIIDTRTTHTYTYNNC